jgi:putative FmdB family regulatory protein
MMTGGAAAAAIAAHPRSSREPAMPTYEYACTDCGKHVEVVQSMSDEPLTTCATCGGRLRKVFSPIGIVFKGSGFYRTDSRGRQPAADGKPATAKKADEAKASSSSKEPKEKPAKSA